MGYSIMQTRDPATGEYADWDGRLRDRPDGTLGSVVIKSVVERLVRRTTGSLVALPANATTTVATYSVPVGSVFKVWGYALSPDSLDVDWFRLSVGGVAEPEIYTRTYAGGMVVDYVLVDNTAGAAPVVVDLVAHNASLTNVRRAGGYVLLEDITATFSG